MKTLQEVGRSIAIMRKERRWTQQQLAEKVGLGQSTLARFEAGGVNEFGARKLLRLLEMLEHEMVFTPINTRPTLDTVLAERREQTDK